jgi:hypothetical protein
MTISRLKRIAGVSLLIALVASCGQKNKPIPAEAKARTEFLASAKLTPDERNLLNRFSARLDTQTVAGTAAPQITVPRALELQRTYETQVTDAQRNFQKLLETAKATLAIEVRDAAVVKDDKAKQPADKALRYVVNITNHGQRTVEQLALRVEFRDASVSTRRRFQTLKSAGSCVPASRTLGADAAARCPAAPVHSRGQAAENLRLSDPHRLWRRREHRARQGPQALETLHRTKIQ